MAGFFGFVVWLQVRDAGETPTLAVLDETGVLYSSLAPRLERLGYEAHLVAEADAGAVAQSALEVRLGNEQADVGALLAGGGITIDIVSTETGEKPWELLPGKIVGVGAVGLLQIGVWIGFIMVLLLAVLPALPVVAAALPSSISVAEMIPGLGEVVFFAVCFVLGYLMYASVFAAVGAAALWEVFLSMVLLVLGLLGMAFVAGKIYRVGILMQGKRPTLPEVWRWVRQP